MKKAEFEFYNLCVYSDGSVARFPHDPPLVPASSANDSQVLTKDVVFNSSNGTWLRLYLPQHKKHSLPILLYFHGGSFLIGSTAAPKDHQFLCKLAAEAQTIVVSVEYRLAPEYPLPCAYDDCFEALLWLIKEGDEGEEARSVDPWLQTHGDFSRVFIGGDSAGGNIAHHVAVKASTSGLFFRGYILIHPFFVSESLQPDAMDPDLVELFRKIWGLCLPEGGNMDHPYANPLASPTFEKDIAALPAALILVCGLEFLRDKNIEYFAALQKAGKAAKILISEGEPHLFHLENSSSPNFRPFLETITSFINS